MYQRPPSGWNTSNRTLAPRAHDRTMMPLGWAAQLICLVLTAPGYGSGLTMASAESEVFDGRSEESIQAAAADAAAAQVKVEEDAELARLVCWQFLNKALLVNKEGSFNAKCLKEVHTRWMEDIQSPSDGEVSGQHCADFLVFAGGDQGLRLMLSELTKVEMEGFQVVFAPLNETVNAGRVNDEAEDCPRAMWPRVIAMGGKSGDINKRMDVAFIALYPGLVTLFLGVGVGLTIMTRASKPRFGKHVGGVAAAAVVR